MDLTSASLFATDLDRLGIALPAQAQRVLDIQAAALTAAHANPAHGLADELTAGTLTPENVAAKVHEAALTATAQEKARMLLRDLSMPARRAFGQAVRDDADRLIRELRKAFTPPAKIMQKAGQLFPVNATGEDVLAAGNDAADAWRELAQARQTLDLVWAARLSLARDYLHEPTTAQPLMVTKGIDSALGQAQAEDAWNTPGSPVGGRWHALTAAGFTLHLATRDEVAQTVTAIATAEQSRLDAERAAEAQKRREENRWLWPTTPSPVA